MKRLNKVLVKGENGETLSLDVNPQSRKATNPLYGKLVFSSIPLSNPALKLLDGTRYHADELPDFYQYLQSIKPANPALFITEEDWQQQNTQYGSCGKYVLTENSVRLPRITNIIQPSALSELGSIQEAGLPNITGQLTFGNVGITGAIGAFTSSNAYGSKVVSGNLNDIANFDASRSNPIYGKSETVQPQTIKQLVYVVVSASYSELTIAEQVTIGTNGAYVVDSYHAADGSAWYREWSDGWLEQGGYISENRVYELVTVNLMRPYKNSFYSLSVTGEGDGSGNAWSSTSGVQLNQVINISGMFFDKTASSFKVSKYDHKSWYACGMKAE